MTTPPRKPTLVAYPKVISILSLLSLLLISILPGCTSNPATPSKLLTEPIIRDSTTITDNDQPAATPNAAPSTPAITHDIAIRNLAFLPTTITIRVGDTIQWTQFDSARHTVDITSGPETIAGPAMASGQTFEHTFSKIGTYTYRCDFHPNMRGTIVVE